MGGGSEGEGEGGEVMPGPAIDYCVRTAYEDRLLAFATSRSKEKFFSLKRTLASEPVSCGD